MRFFNIEYQIWLLIVPLLIAVSGYSFWNWRKKVHLLKGSDLIGKLTLVSKPAFIIKQVALYLAVFFLVLGIMRPRWGTKLSIEKEMGIDIVLAIDISRSMDVRDISPSRLKRVKMELETLMNLLVGNRIGIVLFAGASFVQSPLTTDIGALSLFINGINTRMIDLQGTDVEAALKKSAELLDSKFKRSRIILLFTDGESHEGNAVVTATEILKKYDIKTFTIGIGTKAGSVIPVANRGVEDSFKEDGKGNFIKSKLDEKELIKIANAGGGKFYRIGTDKFDLSKLASKVKNIEKSEVGKTKKRSLIDRYQIFIGVALFFLMLYFFIPTMKEK